MKCVHQSIEKTGRVFKICIQICFSRCLVTMLLCDFLDQLFLDCILESTPVAPICCLCAACWAHSRRGWCWLTSVKLLSWTDRYMYLSVYRETSYRPVSVLYDCVRTLELCRVCECDGRWVLPIALCEALVSIKLAGCVGACVGKRGWLYSSLRRSAEETGGESNLRPPFALPIHRPPIC